MAECIIARGGGRSDGGSSGPPIIADKHTILVTVRDSEGQILQNHAIDCKDGKTWYNYTTNENGQVLFVTNSGAANITAWNFSIVGNYKWIDQESVTQNIDAPVGLSTQLNMNLNRSTSFSTQSLGSNIYRYWTGNYMSRYANKIDLFLGGAGGGGGGFGGGGGGGGGVTLINNLSINTNEKYLFYVGVGGHATSGYTGGSGGTTSAFGYTATGGGGSDGPNNRSTAGTGNYSGGTGSNGHYDSIGEDSQFSNWGGGGSGPANPSDPVVPGGNPYGGYGGRYYSYSNGGNGTNGGGGGSGGAYNKRAGQPPTYGGTGGPGKITINFHY